MINGFKKLLISVAVISLPLLHTPAYAEEEDEEKPPLSRSTIISEDADDDKFNTSAVQTREIAYAIEIGLFASKEDALAEYSRLEEKHPETIGIYEPFITSVHLPRKVNGVYKVGLSYRLRIGLMENKNDATRACFMLKVHKYKGVCEVAYNPE